MPMRPTTNRETDRSRLQPGSAASVVQTERGSGATPLAYDRTANDTLS